jgi:hypothetical protein
MAAMKIALVTPDPADALSFYRASGPLIHLSKNYNFQYEHLANDITWASLKKFDAVFMHRPYLPEHLLVVEMANEWNVPVIGDFDDWLYELPVSNPAHGAFKMHQKTFSQIVNCLDAVMVTTTKLQELMRGICLNQDKPITVVPNAYDHKLFTSYRHDNNLKERKMIFAWRGGNSHNGDLLSVKQDYRNLFASFPTWQFIFIAQNPWILEPAEFKNVQTADALKIVKYFKALHNTAPAILAHPLEDNEFNRAKSMCSWLEATHARAAFIGPDFEEFHRDGILNYNSEKSFFECASQLLNDPQRIVENYWKSEYYIRKHLTLDVVNETRFKCFQNLIK